MTDRLIWIIIALFAVFSAFKPVLLGTPVEAVFPVVSIAAPVLFVLLHAPREIGWRRLGLFFALTFVISWSYETASILTGFPFGWYHYTEKLGPQLGVVPLLIMPAYFGVAYASWIIARLLLDHARSAAPAGTVAMVLTASFVMVMWDLSMDPSRATVSQAWIWHDGGAYFGVPFINFTGWFLCVATIFAAYALTAGRFAAPRAMPDSQALAQALALYGALFLEFVAFAAVPQTGTVTDAAGQVWNLRDLYQTLGLVSIFSMGFVLVSGFLTLRRR
ncbi:MAG: carotenoid biosynthesis protein [Paracoccaceae bacterium]